MHYFKTHIFPILTLLFLQATITLSDHGHSHDEAPHYKYTRAANEPQKPSTPPPPPPASPLDMSTLWTNAMTSTFIISAAPFLIILVIPLQDAHSHQSLLKIMLAFASGGLLGDAFLHLIPHAAMAVEKMSPAHSHSHGGGEHEHSHDMSVGLWVLAGIVSFLIVEKSVRIIKGKHGHSHGDKKEVKNKKSKKDGQQASGDLKVETVETEVKVAGYLNLAADFCHNFTDGLAIGSSYAAGNYVGIVTTVTIFLHEIPHEIGDFAILVQSGVPRTKAIFLQLLTALGAFAGTALPLITQSSAGEIASTWILPFTAGGFIYIALVSVIPELLDEERPSMKQTIYQILAMLFGVYMMVKIAEYE